MKIKFPRNTRKINFNDDVVVEKGAVIFDIHSSTRANYKRVLKINIKIETDKKVCGVVI